jgi:hypothetical protein
MRMQKRLLAALVLAAATAGADEARGIAAGDKVRLTPSSGRRFSAVVVEADGDALVVRTGPEAAPTRVPLAGLERMQVARGRRGHFKTGALIGFLPGFLFGGFVGGALGCDDQGPGCSAGGDALRLGAITGGITGLAGGLVGLAIRTDRWQDVAAPGPRARVGVSLLPTAGGAGARIGLSF